jgi:hypothetical protein
LTGTKHQWRASPAWRLAAAAGLILAVAVSVEMLRKDRGEFRGTDGPALIAPTQTVPAAEAVRMVWHPTPAAIRYQVEVLGAAGDSVFATQTTDTTLALPSSVALARGSEYVWTVRAVFSDGTQAAAAPLRFRVQP